MKWMNLGCALLAGCVFGELPAEEESIDLGGASAAGPSERPLLPRLAVQSDRTLPPVSGGTLEANEHYVVAADPVRDVLWIVSREGGTLQASGQLDLEAGAEPGRMVLRDREAIVVLRRSGSLLHVNLEGPSVIAEHPMCEAPRGLTESRDGFLVACAGGDLIRLDADLGLVDRRHVQPDLRDVVAQYDADGAETVYVSTYRSATVLEMRGGETITHQINPTPDHQPRVAWRMRANQNGGVDILHQQMSDANFTGAPVAYYGSDFTPTSSRIVQSAVAHLRADGSQEVNIVESVPLAVDFVREAGRFWLAGAFIRSRETDPHPGVHSAHPGTGRTSRLRQNVDDTPTQSVASLGDELMVSFSARNGVLLTDGGPIRFAEPQFDTGHDLFHASTPAEVTCASCHPGGRDDAYVWTFNGELRRTQPLTGGVLATAPYHWLGDLAGLEDVMFGTFDTRMNGPDVTQSQVSAMGAWLDALPALRVPPSDMEAVARGESVYAENNCADCHDISAEPASTALGNVQAPPLFGVGMRGPFFHDGCAPTLDEAMGGTLSCVSGHPTIVGEDGSDLVAYLRQL